jgi:acid stress chaperone HdeB
MVFEYSVFEMKYEKQAIVKGWIISALLFAFVGILPAQAQMSVDVAKITCKQFWHDEIGTSSGLALWLSGFYHGKRDNTLVDVSALNNNAHKLEVYCSENPEINLMDAVKKVFGTGR